MSNPGFPIGAVTEPLGGANLRCGHFSGKTYVKTKELDPVGGGAHAGGTPLDPPMKLNGTPSDLEIMCVLLTRELSFELNHLLLIYIISVT